MQRLSGQLGNVCCRHRGWCSYWFRILLLWKRYVRVGLGWPTPTFHSVWLHHGFELEMKQGPGHELTAPWWLYLMHSGWIVSATSMPCMGFSFWQLHFGLFPCGFVVFSLLACYSTLLGSLCQVLDRGSENSCWKMPSSLIPLSLVYLESLCWVIWFICFVWIWSRCVKLHLLWLPSLIGKS
jgi:hypothetical protein